MRCETCREVISACLDGEATEAEQADLEAHLATCADCSAWSARLDRLHRAARVAPADAVPDLSQAIVAAAAAERARWWGLRWETTLVLRWVLVVVAALEIGLAAPEFTHGWHAGGELGTWAVASAVGLLSVAAKTSRAGAVLPMLLCAGFITVFVSARDVVEGRALLSAEWPHGLLVLGVLVILAIWWRERGGEAPGPEVRVASDHGSIRGRVRRATRRAA